MRPRFYQFILAVACAAVVSPVLAQVDLEVKVMRVDQFELAPGIITAQIAKHFNATPSAVESRIKGAVLASLSQEISSSKLLTLAVRDESLERLKKEWKVSEELGSGKSEDALTGPSVDDANYLAYAKIEEFIYKNEGAVRLPGGFTFAPWNIIVDLSLEITTRKTGTKKVIKEVYNYNAIERSVITRLPEAAQKAMEKKYNLVDSDAGVFRAAINGLAKKVGTRVLDVFCPPRIINVRGNMFIVDRGRAAGMQEGHIVELTERADDEFGTDASFPLGKARVKSVKEETSVLELMSTDGAAELAGDKTKLTITRPLDPKTADPEPVAPPPSKTGSSKKSK